MRSFQLFFDVSGDGLHQRQIYDWSASEPKPTDSILLHYVKTTTPHPGTAAAAAAADAAAAAAG